MKLRILAAALLSALLFPLLRAMPAPAADEAAALLAKHAAYAGWHGGDGAIKTLHEFGEATRDGKILERFERLQMGPVYRESASVSGGTFERGFTGRVFWQSNENGFTTRTIGEAQAFLATSDQIADEELTALPGTIRGHETIDGTPTTIVRVVAQAGLPVDLSIDPEDGAFKRITIDPEGKYEQRFDVLADTDVGNAKRVLSAWRYAGGTTVYSYGKIRANVELTPEQLHPPKAVATWTFGLPEQTLPIEIDDKRIVIAATVNGHRGRFVLDTGAGITVFTDTFARAAGAKSVGVSSITGIGGGARANVYRVDTLAFGASTLHDVTVSSGLDERSGDRGLADGLIGFDLLAGAIVELDLDAKTLRIHDPAQVAPDRSQGITLRVDLSTGQPRIPMTVGGKAPVIATLDSGGDNYVLFSSQLISRSHVIFSPPSNRLAARMRMSGVNGSETDPCGRLESLELGPISYRPVPACMSNSMSHDEVLVGFDFFKNFNYVFDYPDGLLLIAARKGR